MGRGNVYSLGVLLYELLTGTTPFEYTRLKEAAQHEVLRIIREEDPPRPSNRISTLGETATRISQLRQTQPDRLGRLVRGDLDWIVMKALEKDRNRRYESPGSLAADVVNHLSNEPVTARPPTLHYRARKYLRRNRFAAAIVGILIATLSCGLLGTFWQAMIAYDALAKQELALAQLEHRTYFDLVEKALTGDDIADDFETFQDNFTEVHQLVLQGLAARNQADIPAAFDFLRRAAEIDADSLHIQALSLQLLITTGNEEEFRRRLSKIENQNPDLIQDKVFLANLLTYSDPSKGLQLIQEAIEERNSVYAQECLAELFSHVAVSDNSLDDAQRALEIARAIHTLEPTKPEFQNVLLWSYEVNLQLRRLQGLGTVELERDARHLADQLSEYRNYSLGLFGAANFFELMGEEERAEEQLEAAYEAGTGFFAVPYAATKFRQGATDEAIAILEKGKEFSHFAELVYAEARTLKSPQDAAHLYATVKDLTPPSTSPRNQWIIPESVLLAGRMLNRARDECQQRLRAHNYVAEWERARLEFVAAENSDEAMLDLFAAVDRPDQSAQLQLMEAYHLVGLKYIAEGKTGKAVEYLRKARRETAAFFWPQAYWSEAIARELERNMPYQAVGESDKAVQP